VDFLCFFEPEGKDKAFKFEGGGQLAPATRGGGGLYPFLSGPTRLSAVRHA